MYSSSASLVGIVTSSNSKVNGVGRLAKRE